MPFSGGTQITDNGNVHRRLVAEGYVPVATDVYIAGTLHDFDGVMYGVQVGTAPVAGSPYINGIRHTVNGVRHFIGGGTFFSVRGGFAADIQGKSRSAGSVTTRQGSNYGIGRGDDNGLTLEGGSMLNFPVV